MYNNFIKLYTLTTCLFLFGFAQHSSAHVLDEVRTKSAQSDYQDNYTLLASYKGEKSGVTFESYSPLWRSTDKLKALEEELLRNKHGEELPLLGKVMIIPDYPAGKKVMGQYFASYQYTSTSASLKSDRPIYLFGGNDFTTVDSMAYVLSHEYGHHFTFYHLINDENSKPGNWLTSDYAKSRELDANPNVHDTDTGEYIWSMPEILAEDYVQLFGSENAIKQSAQMNVNISTPFDTPAIEDYWSKLLPGFEPKNPLSFYLKGAETNPYNPQMYNLQLQLKNLEGDTTYVHAREGTGTYSSVLLDQVTGVADSTKWYNYSQLPLEVSWILNQIDNKQMNLNAIQHEATGFNRGSQTLVLNYENIQSSVTTDADIQKELYQESKSYSTLEIKAMLQETAIQNGIPPEILKAIAFIETGMKQFDSAGQPIIATDGGIGIMQITMSDAELQTAGIDKERLKWDTQYNIETGAKILKQKWNNSNLPKINDKNPNTIENWYFAIMAYNGLSKRNDPNLDHEKAPYQERVLEAIRNYSLLPISSIPKVNIAYPYTDKPDIMSFVDSEYNWPNVGTLTSQTFTNGQKVYTLNDQLSYSKLRDGINGAEIQRLPHYTPIEIIAGPFEMENPSNHYVMYQVKGNGFVGYIASSNLHAGNVTVFSDVKFGEEASAIAYLQLKSIISGYPDGTFKPGQPLLRRHAAAMLVKELGLTLPEGYKMKATDMKPTDLNYQEMMIAEAHGLIGKDGALRPNENLTRAQMAAILARAYENLYAKPTNNAYFTDVKPGDWSYNVINTLAFNKITVTANGAYHPNDNVTRSQFSRFLMRTMELR
ncbi:S-layer homology domain-containing protein [Neobacillus sp. D3-1R]|uniref:S-layer homology domain-containing protein n=1 Tax=Neobacillus sp. D3-1R TaxID=3445778 RepID=UPI003FA13ECB